jgi:hypothetical protein
LERIIYHEGDRVMGEILEKGLLVGFGLSVAIIFFSFSAPFLSIIIGKESVIPNEHDIFVFIMDYGISHEPLQPNEKYQMNMSLTIEISLDFGMFNENYALNVTSMIKSTLIYTSRFLMLHNNSVTGNFTIIFQYYFNYTVIDFRGE